MMVRTVAAALFAAAVLLPAALADEDMYAACKRECLAIDNRYIPRCQQLQDLSQRHVNTCLHGFLEAHVDACEASCAPSFASCSKVYMEVNTKSNERCKKFRAVMPRPTMFRVCQRAFNDGLNHFCNAAHEILTRLEHESIEGVEEPVIETQMEGEEAGGHDMAPPPVEPAVEPEAAAPAVPEVAAEEPAVPADAPPVGEPSEAGENGRPVLSLRSNKSK